MIVRSRFTLGAAMTAIALGLAACAPLSVTAPDTVVTRNAAPAFELQGRLSASDGQQAASGRVEWQHVRGTHHFTLLTPLGQVVAQLDADALGARLQTADGQVLSADSAEALLPQVLGVDVPIGRLGLWVQAAPGPEAEIRNRDSAGRPALVIDLGWRIEYLDYAGESADAPPARLDISRGDARIRLVIDSWTTLP
ncbi:outer membrane lipoprotein LolB [Thauera humireducens]|uniref:Outer-membrane lipoprotein LolB n=1 Tax=Thauera humireducens TaxID=1134435 RepID=A0A127K6X5_9RHOO|nr:outer membrane lipoprotein LolB [Thauera humireducens]ENO75858.1 outer membrane lipoprotein LolB [Thauera sp. 63]